MRTSPPPVERSASPFAFSILISPPPVLPLNEPSTPLMDTPPPADRRRTLYFFGT